MINVKRSSVIRWLSQIELNSLDIEQRKNILSGWADACIDEDNPEFHILHESIKHEIVNQEFPKNVEDKIYNSLILESIISGYVGILNEYLYEQANLFGIKNINITDDVEDLYPCNCCGYKVIEERGGYDICGICFWEDDGNDVPEKYSHVNKMTLKEAQDNFKKFGACSEGSLDFVDKDAKKRYST